MLQHVTAPRQGSVRHYRCPVLRTVATHVHCVRQSEALVELYAIDSITFGISTGTTGSASTGLLLYFRDEHNASDIVKIRSEVAQIFSTFLEH